MGTFAAGDVDYIAKLNALQDAALVFSTKGANFNAANGNIYYITAASVTGTLPASPTAGNRIVFRSPLGGVAGFTLGRNGNNINSAAADFSPTLSNFWLEAIYIDSTVGWQVREMVPFVSVNPTVCDFRLTLTSGTPVDTADVYTATTVYFAPIGGNRIALYDATDGWVVITSAQVSVAVPATTLTPFDIFAYNNAGSLALETVNWTSGTARATALTTQDGVLVKSGDATRRYVGSGCTVGVSGQCADGVAIRYLWNYYNRRRRPMRATDSTNSWAYTTATLRQANANTSNQLNFLIGWQEDEVSANVVASASNTSSQNITVGIGLDSTTALAAGCLTHEVRTPAAGPTSVAAEYRGFPGIGAHFLAWLEQSAAVGTTNWIGDNGNPNITQSGIHGSVMA